MKKVKKNQFVFLIILGIALVAGLILLRQSQETRRKAFYGGVTARVLPSEREVGLGDTFNLRVNINPGQGDNAYLVNGVDLVLSFDKSILTVVDVQLDALFQGMARIEQANQTGELRISAVSTISREQLYQDVFDFAVITFGAAQIGSSSVDRVGEYRIVGSRGQEGNIDRTLSLDSFTPASVEVVEEEPTQVTPTGEITPTEGLGDWPELTFKIKLVGTSYRVGEEQVTVSDIPDQKVVIVVKKGDFREEFKDVLVTFDENAVGTGNLELIGVPIGKNYAVLIKGPVHLARKFCYDEQKERCWLSEEGVEFGPGENNYDWTGLELEPGDINQDGVVDSTDFSQLKQALGTRGEGLKEDLNFNGVVNPQDIVFLLATLSTKYEEEI